MKDKESLACLIQAYMALLQMPHSGVRARQQSTLAALRDSIAYEMGFSGQEVQDAFEELALRKRINNQRALAAV